MASRQKPTINWNANATSAYHRYTKSLKANTGYTPLTQSEINDHFRNAIRRSKVDRTGMAKYDLEIGERSYQLGYQMVDGDAGEVWWIWEFVPPGQ